MLLTKKYSEYSTSTIAKSSFGFTLIELLIVIAVIGTLSFLVLTFLSLAKGRGINTAIKSNMEGMIPQAELYYDDNAQSYAGVCIDPKFSSMLVNATSTGGGTGNCVADTTEWAVYAQLKVPEKDGGLYWCVDSKGASRTLSVLPHTWKTSSCSPTLWSADMAGGAKHTWQDGVNYCSGIVDGSTGWHFPYDWELIEYYQQYDTGTFQSDIYWSATEYPNNNNYAYFVVMTSGARDVIIKTFPYFRVRCARPS